MTLAYIRKTYDVPAKRGARIEWTDERGQKWVGRVVGPSGDGARLKVQFDVNGKRRRSILHPTDNVRYLEKPASPKDRVLAEHPCAHAVKLRMGWAIRSSHSIEFERLGYGKTATMAWREAAERF